VRVAPPERSGRAALASLDRAVAAARTGEVAEPLHVVEADAFRALPITEVRARLDELLVSRHADVGLEVLLEAGFFAAVMPELTKIVGFGDGESHKDVWRHTKQVVIQCLPRLAVRWAALFHDIGKPRTRSVAPD